MTVSSGAPLTLIATRPRPQSEALARACAERGWGCVLSPLLEIRPLGATIDLDGVAALAFTSANGVEAFARLSPDRSRTAFCVGRASAAAARAAGFADVRFADGDVAALAARVAADPPAGAVLHPGGTARAGDLAGALAATGIEARTIDVYEAVRASSLSAEALSALRGARVAEGSPRLAAALFSPRTARAFSRLVPPEALSRIWIAALSPAVVGALETPGSYARIVVAERPDASGLFEALERDLMSGAL